MFGLLLTLSVLFPLDSCGRWVSSRPGSFRYCLFPGCTTWSAAQILSVSRPHHGDRKRCVVKDGMTSHAVCCRAPSLECRLMERASADEDQVNSNRNLKSLQTFPQRLSCGCCSVAGRGVLSLWLDYDRLRHRLSGLHPGTRC